MKYIKVKALTQQASPRARRLRGLTSAADNSYTVTAGGSGLTIAQLTDYFTTKEEAADSAAAAAASYVSEVGTSGDLITWRRGSTLHSFTVPYAAKSAYMRSGGSNEIDLNNIQAGATLHAYTQMSSASPNMPDVEISSAWCQSLIHIGLHDRDMEAAAQLFFTYNAPIMFRPHINAPWRIILDSSNYSTTLNNAYLRRDGTTPMTGDLCMAGKRIYLDAARTVYLWYDSTNDCVRCNKTIASDGNITAFNK